MATPSILSAVKKINAMLSVEDRRKWLSISAFALCSSVLEVATASVIVIFAQVLNQPEIGQKYLSFLGFADNLPTGKIAFYIAMGVLLIYAVKNIVAGFEVFHQNNTIQKINYEFKNKLLHRYAQTDYAYYLTRNSSLGMQVVGGDAEVMFSAGMVSLASILSEGIVFAALIAMVVAMNPSLALIVFLVGGICAFIISRYVFPLFYRWGQQLQDAALHSNKNLQQFFHAFKEIVLLGKKESFVKSYQTHSEIKCDVQARQTATNALPRMIIESLFVVLFVVMVAVLCFKHESPVQMLGILSGYLYVGFRLMPGLNRLINQLNAVKSSIPSIERVYIEYNNAADKEYYLDIPEFIFNDSIKFSNIKFKYLNVEKNALEQINLEIKKGECIGIVGETGSGKSTLVDLLLGLLRPYHGSILVDGIYPVNSHQWHRDIGYVPQAIYLIDDTIEANIAFGEEYIDYEKLNAAIDAAQLRKFIDQLPQGLETIVGERGIRLSGGERQRIAIARALYRNPEVLVFDEATSALDNDTEAKLMETIRAVSVNRTVIMVAHRLTTLKDCNRIIAMESGNIKSVNSYASLGVK